MWRGLDNSNSIQACDAGEAGGFFTSSFRLTEAGIEMAASDEYKAVMNVAQKKPTTNEELHKSIKEKLMNKREDEIFDLLLKQGRFNRVELAKALGISHRGANFSYALQQLKDLGYVEFDPESKGAGKKLRLSKKAFVDPPGEQSSSADTE